MPSQSDMLFRFRSLDGAVFHLRLRSLTEYSLNLAFVRFISTCGFLNVASIFVLHAGEKSEDNSSFYLNFVMAGVIYIVVMVIWLMLFGSVLSWFYKRNLIKTVYTPLFYAVPLGGVVVYGAYHGADVLTPQWLNALFAFTVIFGCMDLLHSRFVAPLHPGYRPASADTARPDMAAQKAPAAAPAGSLPAPETEAETDPAAPSDDAPPLQPDITDNYADGHLIEIGKHRIRRADLRWVRSADNYLDIALTNKTILVRENLSDVIPLLSLDDGVQVNRSIWVAFKEIKSLEESDRGRLLLTRHDGETLFVPKMRKYAVNQSYDAYLKRTGKQD